MKYVWLKYRKARSRTRHLKKKSISFNDLFQRSITNKINTHNMSSVVTGCDD